MHRLQKAGCEISGIAALQFCQLTIGHTEPHGIESFQAQVSIEASFKLVHAVAAACKLLHASSYHDLCMHLHDVIAQQFSSRVQVEKGNRGYCEPVQPAVQPTVTSTHCACSVCIRAGCGVTCMRGLRAATSTYCNAAARIQPFSASPAALPLEDAAHAQQSYDHDRRLREMHGATALASEYPGKASVQEGRHQQHLPSVKEVSQLLKPASAASCASSSPSTQLEAQTDWRHLLAALKAQQAQGSQNDVLTDTFGCVATCNSSPCLHCFCSSSMSLPVHACMCLLFWDSWHMPCCAHGMHCDTLTHACPLRWCSTALFHASINGTPMLQPA